MQATDILIHVKEQLDRDQQQILESDLRNIDGVVAPRFNKPHLLLVSYDSEMTKSSELLSVVKSRGYVAQLIGM